MSALDQDRPGEELLSDSEGKKDDSAIATPPKVFMSYSHDSPEHKKWVGDLASKLMDQGVDVILDQWDLGLGDDVPKFMEKGVSEADRVLMICTEIYVRKADDGKGGVGYEAMIVTAELVKNLGTAKFIPIIRQTGSDTALPKSVGTRRYLNLSNDTDFATGFEELVRELHQIPAIKKPSLGKNSFTSGAKAITSPTIVAASENAVKPDAVLEFYSRAADAARSDDLAAWRRTLVDARRISFEGLGEWQKRYTANPPKTAPDTIPMVHDAFAAIAPLLGVAFAGVESGREKFHNQISIVDELLSPHDWRTSGLTVVTELPDALAFLYQALHGALCLETGQMHLAVRLVRSKFRRQHHSKNEIMVEESAWMGWPQSISDSCTVAWDFLTDLPDRHPWLLHIFGTKDEYLVSLSSYYAVLNIVELTELLAHGKGGFIKGQDSRLTVPLCGFSIADDLAPRAFRRMVQEPALLKAVWEKVGVSTELVADHWPRWIETCEKWMGSVYRGRFYRSRLFHAHLLEEPEFRSPQSRSAA